MLDIVYSLEMIGIVAFAISGMVVARSKNMDPVGVFTIGFMTALGGGTLRDLIMANHPVYWIKHEEQPILILAMAIVFSYWKRSERIRESWIVLPDAIGLGTFSILGAQLCSSTIPYPTGQRSAGAKSEAIIGVSGGNRPSYSKRFRETPCADPHAGCCGG